MCTKDEAACYRNRALMHGQSLPTILDKRLLFARAAMMRLRAGLSSPPPKLAPSFSLFREASPGTLSALLARLKVRPARDTGKHWEMSLGSSRPCEQQKIGIVVIIYYYCYCYYCSVQHFFRGPQAELQKLNGYKIGLPTCLAGHDWVAFMTCGHW